MKGEGEGKQQRRETMSVPWSDLPPEILSVILGWLPAGDRARFRAVCRSWYNSPQAMRPAMPWLLMPSPDKGEAYFYFYSPWEDRTYEVPIPKECKSWYKVKGSSPDGEWLVYLDEQCDFHAVHLLTRKHIQPPSMTTFAGITHVRRELIIEFITGAMVFLIPPCPSSPASSATQKCQFMFVFIFARMDGSTLAFAREGDTSWKQIDLPGFESLNCLLMHRGSLYATTMEGFGEVVRVDGLLSSDPNSTPPSIVVVPNRFAVIASNGNYRRRAILDSGGRKCLAVIRGRLWMVSINRRPRSSFGRDEKWRKWRAKFLRLNKAQTKWVEKSSLGSYVIFAGIGCSLVHSTRRLRSTQLGRDRVYLDTGYDCAPRQPLQRTDSVFANLQKYDPETWFDPLWETLSWVMPGLY